MHLVKKQFQNLPTVSLAWAVRKVKCHLTFLYCFLIYVRCGYKENHTCWNSFQKLPKKITALVRKAASPAFGSLNPSSLPPSLRKLLIPSCGHSRRGISLSSFITRGCCLTLTLVSHSRYLIPCPPLWSKYIWFLENIKILLEPQNLSDSKSTFNGVISKG